MLIELFYIGMPVVWRDGRAYVHVTTKISRMYRLPNFLTHGAPLCALHMCESSANILLLYCLIDEIFMNIVYQINVILSNIVFEWRVQCFCVNS